jgi:phage-related tail fiber protein
MKLLRVEKISFVICTYLRITTCCYLHLKRVFIYQKIATPKQTQRTTLHSTYQTMSETEAAAAAAPAATDAPKKKGGAGGKKTEKKATKEPERRSARAKKAPVADTMTAPAVKAAA